MFQAPQIVGCGLFDSSISFPNMKRSDPRDVRFFELELFTEQSGISVLNGIQYPIDKGCLLLGKPGDIRYTHLDIKTLYIHFIVKDEALASRLMELPTFLRLSDDSAVKSTLLDINARHHSADAFDRISASARLVTLLESIRRLGTDGVPNESTVHRAKAFMEQNYSEKIDVRTIAKHCNVSEPHLYRLFREFLHISPNEYLLEVKLSGACRLLCNTDLPINEIAMDCGFNSQSYFSDCFKRKMGTTPFQYRQAYKYKL